MARDRQRAKQRQAARRSARLGERPDVPPGSGAPGRDGSPHDEDGKRAEPANGDAALADAQLAVGAPPESIGRSDAVLEPAHESGGIPQAADLDDRQAGALERQAAGEPAQAEPDPARPDQEGVPADAGAGGPLRRFPAFVVACWAELKRVQWPARAQLFSLTGVVLGFCVIAGGYLGLLDLVFSRLIRLIL